MTLELLARTVVGLGSPALSIADPEIEYMFCPNQHVYRFGNLNRYNAYGMRSDDFDARRTDANELRVLVVGDSVINGGHLTDQSELGTELLRDELQRLLGQPVVVGNVSAGSWGPPNQLAYLRRYGWFDADLVLIVSSHHDAWDCPTFKELNPKTHPTRSPASAFAEGVIRYGPRLWQRLKSSPASNAAPTTHDWMTPENHAEALGAMEQIIVSAQSQGIAVGMLLHRNLDGLEDPTPEGEMAFAQLAADHDVPTIHLSDRFAACVAGGESPYRDNIHPNARGQQLLADAYRDMAARLLIERSLAGPRTPMPGVTLASIEQVDRPVFQASFLAY